MKRVIRASTRYYIADYHGIPYRSQPETGYTKLGVISAVQRYAEEDARLFGGKYTDYIHDYCILDNKYHDVTDEFNDLV